MNVLITVGATVSAPPAVPHTPGETFVNLGCHEPLNLTEENKAELRTLVNAITQGIPQEPITTTVPVATGIGLELGAIVRRAFVTKMVTQIYNSSPLVAKLLQNGPTPTKPLSIQGVPIVFDPAFPTGARTTWTDYSGTFEMPETNTVTYRVPPKPKFDRSQLPGSSMEARQLKRRMKGY